MNWTAALLLAGFLHVSAAGYTQGKITLSLKKASLQNVFAAIGAQSGYTVWYDVDVLKNTTPVDMDVKNVSLQEALTIACKDQPLEFNIRGKMIVIKARIDKSVNDPSEKIDLKGRVLNEKGEPAPGISVTIKNSQTGAMTDADGWFELLNVDKNSILVFSGANIETKEESLNGRKELLVVVKIKVGRLDDVQVIGYGTTTKRLSTANVSSVSSKEIEQQPISNPLEALQGRVPGMFIQSSSGIPGNNLTVQIRGINSIAAGTYPLYVIDGVPFTSTSLDLLSLSVGSTTTPKGLSPLNNIDPDNIERIDILKDADATAIYGSRAANGVVIITTKKGQNGKTRLTLNLYSGIEQVPHFIKMLNIQQYLQIRRTAFANDGITPTAVNAPDLLVWDTTQNTNWQKKLIGSAAQVSDAQLSISSGNIRNRFLLSGSYHYEGSVLPENIGDKRINGYLNLEHNSSDNKFYANLSSSYSMDKNNLVGDPTPYLNLPPDDPIYDSTGKLFFRPNRIQEPYTYLNLSFNTQTNNFISNLNLRYALLGGLNIQCNSGYTQTDLSQIQMTPAAAQNPARNPLGYTYFGNNHLSSWIFEPQLNFVRKLKAGTINLLLGGTWQQSLTQGEVIDAEAFTSDALLNNIASAGNISILSNSYLQYNYTSVFGRVNYNLKDKYILNGSFRRDGSSRFGPGRQFGNFGAIGAAWIFSSETCIKENIHFLSFGKLRSSYGITGNDQITDYQYLSTYVPTPYTYQIPGLRASRIANPDYSWETNRKLEISLDLGFLNNRILLSTAYFRNRSGNQLVNYPLAGQSGFASFQSNLPALVQNSGWEITTNTVNFNSRQFKWNSSFNITLSQSKLLSFPGLAGSSYGTTNLVIGQPLNLVWGYHYLGVDPATGLAQIQDIDHDGMTNFPNDYIHFGTTLPDYYGGLNNTISYKGFEFSFLFEFVKKIAQSLRSGWYSGAPGTFFNQEANVWTKIWKQSGDRTPLPKPSTKLPYYYALSDAGDFENASFIKLKNLNLSYSLSDHWLKKKNIQNFRIFIHAQNLFTITHYEGFDPEASSATVLPNLRVITAGLHCEL
jgi:TonB-linked SusC/RagA family outer membrane protein